MDGRIDPFESPKLLLARALDGINDFEAQVIAFAENSSWTQGGEYNPENGETRMFLTLQSRIPGNTRVLASEIVNNLRHVLDQAVTAASHELGSTSVKKTYFPFAKSKAGLPAQIKYRCKDVPAELIPHLLSYGPSRDGDAELWALGHMAGPNKHQMILAVDVNIESIHIVRGKVKGATFGHFGYDKAKRELNLGRLKPGGRFSCPDLLIPIEVVLGPTDVVGGQGAAVVFRSFAAKVGAILRGIEAETARLLSLRPKPAANL